MTSRPISEIDWSSEPDGDNDEEFPPHFNDTFWSEPDSDCDCLD